MVVTDVGRLRTLVEELMELSRFDADAEQVALEPVDLGRLVETMSRGTLPAARFTPPASPIVVDADPRRLERILANFLDNAKEHAADADVEIAVEPRDEDIVIAVSDRGPGVPPDRLEMIFDRFTKVDPSRSGGSSGLGLAIAAEHAALHGRLSPGHEPGRRRASDRARAAARCCRIVTWRRCDGDLADRG